MKVVAIGGRGSRKDFVDLYFYLRGAGGLDSMFTLLRRRFTEVDYNEYHLLKSLVFFEDAETEPMPMLILVVAHDHAGDRRGGQADFLRSGPSHRSTPVLAIVRFMPVFARTDPPVPALRRVLQLKSTEADAPGLLRSWWDPQTSITFVRSTVCLSRC